MPLFQGIVYRRFKAITAKSLGQQYGLFYWIHLLARGLRFTRGTSLSD